MKSFLAELINADFTKRKELSARQDEKGIIAELSLYVLPMRLVLAYTQAVDLDFWETWDSLGEKDILTSYGKLIPKMTKVISGSFPL